MDVEIDHILCTIDFSKFTTPVLQAGIDLAVRFEASLTIFHAVCQPQDSLYNDGVSGRDQSSRRQAAQAEKQIETLMSTSPVSWMPAVAIGEPVEELERLTEKSRIDLVVAASYGLSGFKRMFMGTVVERMARVLSHPMLIIRPTETDNGNLQKYRKIIVACDMCIEPDPVILMALTMAAENDTELFLFHANASPMNTDVVDSTDAPYQQVQQTMQASQAQKLVTGIPAWARDRYLFETVLRPGRPDEALADYITENQPDLIVVGVKKSRLKRLFIGSTTENTLRRAACTVLTVPLLAEGRPE
jgi:nucleotide-binding universal stress UspA family protein